MFKPPKLKQNSPIDDLNRRRFMVAGGTATVAALAAVSNISFATEDPYADPAEPALPPSDMVLEIKRAALVVTDPQIDFLSPDGVTWGVVGASVTQHDTVANIGRLLDAAKKAEMTVAVSPHHYYPTDKGW
jgi:hypothetical protein